MCERKRHNAYSDVAIVVKGGTEVIALVPEKLPECCLLVTPTLLVSLCVYKRHIDISTLRI